MMRAMIFLYSRVLPLNSMASCNSDETTDCLLAIDTKLGKLISSKLFPENVVVYKYHSNNSSASNVLAFVFGFKNM